MALRAPSGARGHCLRGDVAAVACAARGRAKQLALSTLRGTSEALHKGGERYRLRRARLRDTRQRSDGYQSRGVRDIPQRLDGYPLGRREIALREVEKGLGCGHRPRGALDGMREHALRMQREGVTGAARRMLMGEEEGRSEPRGSGPRNAHSKRLCAGKKRINFLIRKVWLTFAAVRTPLSSPIKPTVSNVTGIHP